MNRRTAIDVGFCVAVGTASGQESKSDPKSARLSAKDFVEGFYRNLAAGKSSEALTDFANDDSAVSGVGHFRDPKPWKKSPAEYMKQHGDKPKYLQVESVEIDPLHSHLAVARVKYKAGGVKGFAVLTLTSDMQRWRITSLFEETHFVW